MLTDISTRKLVIDPAVGWQKNLVPAKHSRLRSSTGASITSHQGYLALVRYSVTNSPITMSAGIVLQELVANAAGRPFLVYDPLDFKATIANTHDGYGGWTTGIMKFLGGRQAVGPTICKVYGVEGVRNVQNSLSRHRVLFRPITYLENGIVDVQGAALPFTLDPITREVLINGQRMVPPNSFTQLGVYPQQTQAANYLKASFEFCTPMEVTEFTLTPASGASVQQALIAGHEEQCVAYYLSMTLTEVVPVFDPVLQFDTVESVTPFPLACPAIQRDDLDSAETASSRIDVLQGGGFSVSESFANGEYVTSATGTASLSRPIIWHFLTDVCYNAADEGVAYTPVSNSAEARIIATAICAQPNENLTLYLSVVQNNVVYGYFGDAIGSLISPQDIGLYRIFTLNNIDPVRLQNINNWQEAGNLNSGVSQIVSSSQPDFSVNGSELRFGMLVMHTVAQGSTHNDAFRLDYLEIAR